MLWNVPFRVLSVKKSCFSGVWFACLEFFQRKKILLILIEWDYCCIKSQRFVPPFPFNSIVWSRNASDIDSAVVHVQPCHRFFDLKKQFKWHVFQSSVVLLMLARIKSCCRLKFVRPELYISVWLFCHSIWFWVIGLQFIWISWIYTLSFIIKVLLVSIFELWPKNDSCFFVLYQNWFPSLWLSF